MTNLVARILSGENVTETAAETRDLLPLFAVYPVASLLYGSDGVVAAANAAALTLFRCGTEQLVGASLSALDLRFVGNAPRGPVVHRSVPPWPPGLLQRKAHRP